MGAFEFGDTAAGALGVFDVVEQKGAAAVEFEIEIAFVGFGLHEEFDATVAADGVLIIRVDAADVAVFDAEKYVQFALAINDLRLRARAMIAAFRTKMFDLKGFNGRPNWIVPARFEARRAERLLHHIFHRHKYR